MKKIGLEKRHNLTGWAFLIPAALLIFVFCFYPMAQAILLSFRKTNGEFTGISNYARILQDKTFQQCLFNTIFYFIVQVPIMLILALGLAQLLNSPHIKGKGIFRTLYFPSMCDFTCILFYDFQILICSGWSRKPSAYFYWWCSCGLVPEYMAGTLGHYHRIGLEMDRLQHGILSCRFTEY